MWMWLRPGSRGKAEQGLMEERHGGCDMLGCEASDFRQFLSLSRASVSPSRLGLLWGVRATTG